MSCRFPFELNCNRCLTSFCNVTVSLCILICFFNPNCFSFSVFNNANSDVISFIFCRIPISVIFFNTTFFFSFFLSSLSVLFLIRYCSISDLSCANCCLFFFPISEIFLLSNLALAISWILSESIFSFNQFCVLLTLNITDPSIAGVVIFGQKRSF